MNGRATNVTKKIIDDESSVEGRDRLFFICFFVCCQSFTLSCHGTYTEL